MSLPSPTWGRTTQAMAGKLQVLEKTEEMVLAEHYTPIGSRLRAVTVETVVLERPARGSFRLLRGPVPHVVEQFELTEHGGRATLSYSGEFGNRPRGRGCSVGSDGG